MKRFKKGYSSVVVRFRPLVGNESRILNGVPTESSDSKSVSVQSNIQKTEKSKNFSGFNKKVHTSYKSKNNKNVFQTSRKKVKKTTFSGFKKVFTEQDNNKKVFHAVILPLIKKPNFGNVCVFCYGHSGAGKTHTILGYKNEKGVFTQSIEFLCAELKKYQTPKLFLNIKLAELLGDKVSDLLNKKAQCFVRDDGNGNFLIRSESIVNKETGSVRVNSLSSCTITNVKDAQKVLHDGINQRAVGSSTIHHQSSRSHALISIEVVTKELLDIREKLAVAQSEIIPMFVKLDKLRLEMMKSKKQQAYKYTYVESIEVVKRDIATTQELISNLRKNEIAYLQKAKEKNNPAGSLLVFVDLAGSDFETYNSLDDNNKVVLSDETKRESKLINLSLFSLKECVKAIRRKKPHVPFRNSKLTMILKRYLVKNDSKVLMISNCSPCVSQVFATLNTLKYAQLVARMK